jgi:hypothetical protein
VRKQYFFSPSEGGGFDAWDVDRLIRLTSHLPVVEVALDQIGEIGENYWYNSEGDVPTVRSMVDHMKILMEADTDFPVILNSEGRVMDGMHRIAKALYLGFPKIKAVRFPSDPLPDYKGVLPNELPYD